MKLIREWFALCEDGICGNYLTESERKEVKDSSAMYLTGKLGAYDEENHNGRIYPKDVLVREVEAYKALIEERRSLGELDHPDSAEVSLQNASHMVTDLWWEGSTLMGKLKLLSTENGIKAKALVSDGVQLGISSRSLGSLDESRNGPAIVQDDLVLICWDLVSEPSSINAFVNPVALTESAVRKAVSMKEMVKRKMFTVLKDL